MSTEIKILLALLVLSAVAWFGFDYAHSKDEAKNLLRAVNAQQRHIGVLERRAALLERLTTANQSHDANLDAQVAKGARASANARRSDHATQSIDVPYPPALRGRVFNDSDVTGRTARAAEAQSAAGAGDPR